MTPKAEKLLRLALCPGAAEGEMANAAVAFVREVRSSGETFEKLFGLPERRPRGGASWYNPPPPKPAPSAMKMPFGKHKGTLMKDIPSDYLRWVLLNLEKLAPELRKIISEELASRTTTSR